MLDGNELMSESKVIEVGRIISSEMGREECGMENLEFILMNPLVFDIVEFVKGEEKITKSGVSIFS